MTPKELSHNKDPRYDKLTDGKNRIPYLKTKRDT